MRRSPDLRLFRYARILALVGMTGAACTYVADALLGGRLISQQFMLLPILAFGLVLGIFVFPSVERKLVRQQRAAAGLCTKCGYNLTGNTSGVCPECGGAL
jgi:hypothetical protein